MDKSFFQASLFVLVISNMTNLFSYLFQFSMGRLLSVEEFGVLSVLNSYSLMLGVILGVLTYVVTNATINFQTEQYPDNTSTYVFKVVLKISSVVILLLISLLHLFSVEVMSFSNIRDKMSFYILLIYLASDAIMGMLLGFLQGFRKYLDVSIKRSAGSFVRLVLAIFSVAVLGGSYNSALLASFLANVTIITWCFFQLREALNVKVDNKEMPPIGNTIKKLLRDGVPITITLSLIAIICNLDLLLANAHLTEHLIGQYSASSIIAKVAIFFPGVLLPVLFPEVVDKFNRKQSTLKTFFITLSITVLMVVLYSFVVNFYSRDFVLLFFGDKYHESSEILSLVTVSMSIVAVSSVFLNYFLATRKFLYIYGVALLVPLFFVLSSGDRVSDLQSLSQYVFYCSASLMLVSVCVFTYGLFKRHFQ